MDAPSNLPSILIGAATAGGVVLFLRALFHVHPDPNDPSAHPRRRPGE